MFRARGRFTVSRAVVVAAVATLLLSAVWLASASSAAAAAQKHLAVSAKAPEVVTAGDRAKVRGRVRIRGRLRRARRPVRIALQQRVGKRWVVRARGRARGQGRKRRYAIRWRAPRRRAVVRLRVVARVGKRGVVSRPARVAVASVSVLRTRRVARAPRPGRPGVLRYKGRADVRRGEYIALGVGRTTPHGLLARAVAVKRGRQSTIVRTRPATLPEVVPVGHFSIAPGRMSANGAAGAAARPSFRSQLSCSAAASGELTGSMGVDLSPRLEVGWSWLRVNRAEASVTVTGRAELSARLAAAGQCSLAQTPVATWTARPIQFQLGPVPVVIVPRTTVHVSATAHASGAATAGISGHASATAGLRYDGDVHPIGSYEHGFAHTPPTGELDASIGGRVIPSVTFLIYGAAGPRFDLATGLQLDAGLLRDPRWTLTAPVELRAGLEVPGFGGLSVEPRTVYATSFPIAEGPRAPLVADRARIVWDTDESDVDLHVWDDEGNHAYYSQPDAIPDAELSDDDVDGFGPESFTDHAPDRRRTFTYGICYYDDDGVGASEVTVTLKDPYGGGRETIHTLSDSGDSVLVGPSPPGSGYTPDDDWC